MDLKIIALILMGLGTTTQSWSVTVRVTVDIIGVMCHTNTASVLVNLRRNIVTNAKN